MFDVQTDLLWCDIETLGPDVEDVVAQAIKYIHHDKEDKIEIICSLNAALDDLDLTELEIQEIIWFVEDWSPENDGGFLPEWAQTEDKKFLN